MRSKLGEFCRAICMAFNSLIFDSMKMGIGKQQCLALLIANLQNKFSKYLQFLFGEYLKIYLYPFLHLFGVNSAKTSCLPISILIKVEFRELLAIQIAP